METVAKSHPLSRVETKGWRQSVRPSAGRGRYGSTKEVAALVLRFSRGGLWKDRRRGSEAVRVAQAAAKCLLLKIGPGTQR